MRPPPARHAIRLSHVVSTCAKSPVVVRVVIRFASAAPIQSGGMHMRRRFGSIFKRRGSWWARVRYVDPVTRKTRTLERAARTRAAACDIRDELLRELDENGGRSFAFEKATFDHFADWYRDTYLVEPTYVNDRKVAGLRSWRDQRHLLTVLRVRFGSYHLRNIAYGDLRAFKAERIAAPTRTGGQRAIATINRELNLLRRMLNVALQEGWIARNPFALGDSLISLAHEHQRQRILTPEEERRLLSKCQRPRYRHLIPIIICAIDTGMRSSELFQLRWADIDFDDGIINVRAFNTKTMRARQVGITARLRKVLYELGGVSPEKGHLVFGITDTVKNAFNRVRADADLKDLRFHDLRHTAATRLVQGGLSFPEVGRILGHTQPGTTYRYVNADARTAVRAAAILDNSIDAEEGITTEQVM